MQIYVALKFSPHFNVCPRSVRYITLANFASYDTKKELYKQGTLFQYSVKKLCDSLFCEENSTTHCLFGPGQYQI
jgi:hypothetical protein